MIAQIRGNWLSWVIGSLLEVARQPSPGNWQKYIRKTATSSTYYTVLELEFSQQSFSSQEINCQNTEYKWVRVQFSVSVLGQADQKKARYQITELKPLWLSAGELWFRWPVTLQSTLTDLDFYFWPDEDVFWMYGKKTSFKPLLRRESFPHIEGAHL